MYIQSIAALLLLSTFTVAYPAAIPPDSQASRSNRRNDNLISVRQAQEQSSTSTISSTTPTPVNNTANFTNSRTAATSSPLLTPAHKNHNVAVGFNGSSFTPTTLKNISLSDTISFYFYPQNFSIAQSTFSRPCAPITGDANQHSIFSGFSYYSTTGISLNKFVVNVTTTDPIWIYGYDGNASNGGNVCQRGMAMVINPLPKDRAGGQTLKAYIKSANAMTLDMVGATVEKVPGKIFGGEKVRLTARQKQLWESKHPQGVAMNVDDMNDSGVGIGMNGTSPDKQIAPFQSGANRGISAGAMLAGLVISLVAYTVL